MDAQLGAVLCEIVDAAIGGWEAGTQLCVTGASAELALPGQLPLRQVAVGFIEALHDAVRRHNADCDPAAALRLRMALAAQDAPEGVGEKARVVRDLVGAPVIRRVAAQAGRPLAVIASADWYDSIIRPGHGPADGYQQVQVTAGDYHGLAWVSVPGQTRPHGLTPADITQARPGKAQAQAAKPPGRNVVQGGSHGIVIQADVINDGVHIGNRYVPDPRAAQDRR